MGEHGPFGPVITRGIDSASLVVRTIFNGNERLPHRRHDLQRARLVGKISHDMTLLPGDLIASERLSASGS